MFLALMQTNPDILPLLGRTFDGFKNDLNRLEKLEELKVKCNQQIQEGNILFNDALNTF